MMRIRMILLTVFMAMTAVLALYTLNAITPLDFLPSKEQGYRTIHQQQRHDDVYCLAVTAEEAAEQAAAKEPAAGGDHRIDGHAQTEEKQHGRFLPIEGQDMGLRRGKDTEIGLDIQKLHAKAVPEAAVALMLLQL